MHELSKFLPDNFDENARLAILAGKGQYPEILHSRLKSAGIDHVLMAFEDETSPELWNDFDASKRYIMNVGQLGKLLKSLKTSGAKYAIMAGQITPKKLFKGMKPDLKAILTLAKLKRKNAETIFGAVADALAGIGVEMLDARSFLDADTAPIGLFCGRKWTLPQDYVDHAIHIARECARLDIGQSCVTARGTVLAVESFDGTDKMLERVAQFEAKDALFAKTVKPNQDYRFDVPVIGERTVRKLAEAGIKNAVVEAGNVIILDSENVKKIADSNGIKILGI